MPLSENSGAQISSRAGNRLLHAALLVGSMLGGCSKEIHPDQSNQPTLEEVVECVGDTDSKSRCTTISTDTRSSLTYCVDLAGGHLRVSETKMARGTSNESSVISRLEFTDRNGDQSVTDGDAYIETDRGRRTAGEVDEDMNSGLRSRLRKLVENAVREVGKYCE